jgi:hypothetical protein
VSNSVVEHDVNSSKATTLFGGSNVLRMPRALSVIQQPSPRDQLVIARTGYEEAGFRAKPLPQIHEFTERVYWLCAMPHGKICAKHPVKGDPIVLAPPVTYDHATASSSANCRFPFGTGFIQAIEPDDVRQIGPDEPSGTGENAQLGFFCLTRKKCRYKFVSNRAVSDLAQMPGSRRKASGRE